MARKVKVNTGSMKQLHQELESSVTNLKKNIKALEESVKELNATWEGPNKDFLEQQYNALSEELVDMTKALSKYNDSFEKAIKKYEKKIEEVNNHIKKR